MINKIKIGNIQLDNCLIAAPLAGYTNIVYREFLHKYGAGLVVSEMISDNALIYNNKETLKLIETSNDERPVALQLFGGSKETLLQAIDILETKAKYDILDINLGCPVPKVIKQNAGSAWLKEEREEELFEMLKAVVTKSSKPVTIKIRTGFDAAHLNCVKVCQMAEKAGVSLIAIHGRTRNQFYEGMPNYDIIADCKKAVEIPIVANGNINSLEDYIHVKAITHADGYMIGRGALGNPLIFREILDYENGLKREPYTLEDKKCLLIEHMDRLISLKGEYIAIRELRTIAPHYFKSFDGARMLRSAIVKANTRDDVVEIISKI